MNMTVDGMTQLGEVDDDETGVVLVAVILLVVQLIRFLYYEDAAAFRFVQYRYLPQDKVDS